MCEDLEGNIFFVSWLQCSRLMALRGARKLAGPITLLFSRVMPVQIHY
jgi:hypothetical protein